MTNVSFLCRLVLLAAFSAKVSISLAISLYHPSPPLVSLSSPSLTTTTTFSSFGAWRPFSLSSLVSSRSDCRSSASSWGRTRSLTIRGGGVEAEAAAAAAAAAAGGGRRGDGEEDNLAKKEHTDSDADNEHKEIESEEAPSMPPPLASAASTCISFAVTLPPAGGGIGDDEAEIEESDGLVQGSTPATTTTTTLAASSVVRGAASATATPTAAAAAGSDDNQERVELPPLGQDGDEVLNLVGGKRQEMGPNSPPPGLLRRTLPWFPWRSLPDWLTYARCIAVPLLVAVFYSSPNHAGGGGGMIGSDDTTTTTTTTGVGNIVKAICNTLSLRNSNVWSCAIFAIASITDFLDGYLARRWDITSPFGAFLDPVADKLMVSTALILLSGRYGPSVALPSAIILARELAVSALREWMAQRGKRDSVKVGMQGKVKTAATMVALTLLLLVPAPPGNNAISGAGAATATATWIMGKRTDLPTGMAWLFRSSMALLFASAIVTVTSGSVYFRAAAPILLGKDNDDNDDDKNDDDDDVKK